MIQNRSKPKHILIVSGHDPCGAGIQADIETCQALECYPATIITGITAQNTRKLSKIKNLSAYDFRVQLETLLDEFSPEVCKVGLINSFDLMATLSEIVKDRLPTIPIVVDPILNAGSGAKLFSEEIISGYLNCLIPIAEIITPNQKELKLLSRKKVLSAGVDQLLSSGCKNVLVTDIYPRKKMIHNHLYSKIHEEEKFEMERFSGIYHGTGCTLSSAIACQLANGADIKNAVNSAQKYTHATVQFAHDFGWEQLIPNRFF
jgi:hydroxymethylpyrimidine/phosphomethylpyrimidine kinase